jgi:hypothetical protein
MISSASCARFGDAEPDHRHFIGDAGRRPDFQPATGEMVEHGDFFDHAPRLVIRHDHAHDAEP